MKNVLIIAHYFTPLNSTGARRPEALVKYLAKKNYHVTVLTTLKNKNLSTSVSNDTNIKVIESSITLTRIFQGTPKQKKTAIYSADSVLVNFKRKFINPIFGQIFDHRLLFVLGVIIKFSLNTLTSGKIFQWVNSIKKTDFIISTSPPWICHLLALSVAKYLNVPFVLDYRDQFSGNHMFSQRFGWLEKKIDSFLCGSANLVVTVSEPMADYYRNITKNPVIVVMNGFDEDMFSSINAQHSTSLTTDSYLIRYFGTITSDRLMPSLWLAMDQLKSIKNIQFEFYGDNQNLRLFLTNKFPNLLGIIKFIPLVSHETAIKLMYESDALLFTETSNQQYASQQGVLTTKLFEYLATGKPIIGIIDEDTQAGRIIKHSGLGLVINVNPKKIRDAISLILSSSHSFSTKPDIEYISNLSRSSQFKILENSLDSL